MIDPFDDEVVLERALLLGLAFLVLLGFLLGTLFGWLFL